ncbi:MAG: PSD1 and planctomycete cytochrome C domain-containing protein [Crocinitomicaceae bacterium]
MFKYLSNVKSFLLAFISFAVMYFVSCADSKEDAEVIELSKAIPDQVDYNFHIKPILSDRCFACHGPDEAKRSADLALHTKEGLFAESAENPGQFIVVPGKPEESLLYQRITDKDHGKIMPPIESNLELNDSEIELIKKWIEQGAKWKKHWSLISPIAATLPKVDKNAWGQETIDVWTEKGMESVGLTPSEQASPERLLRRLSLDVRGVPPTEEEVKEFIKGNIEENYRNKIQEYLGSVDHAEKLTTWWLDLARYADSHGYQDDLERQNWPWRDWVIHAFNKNQRYDEFVTWQLAGDLIPEANLESILATTFNRNHKVTQEGGVIDEEYRVDYVADRTGTFFTAFQGMTMECARCHDHKYDPISQKDFFSSFAFFNMVPENGLAAYGEVPKPNMEITKEKVESILSFIHAPDSVLPVRTMIMKDDPNIRKTFVLGRGQYDQPGEEVNPTTPNSILTFEENLPQNRLGLANWLFDKKNPLTARVIVNRVWQLYFGRGIVATPNDMGNQGALPTHPELLDALAYDFMESGWDLRALEKRILLSKTYQQDSKVSEKAKEIDPENIYLSRATQMRLSAEEVRDQVLAVSGLLVKKVGGPPVKPYQPEGLWEEKTSGGGYTTYVQQKGENLYRKSMYTFWKRTVPPPSMLTFDAPTRDFCTVSRQNTNTPLQALVLLNDPQQLEAARVLAESVLSKDGKNVSSCLKSVYLRVLSREPEKDELEVLKNLYQKELNRYKKSKDQAKELISIGEYPRNEQLDAPEVAAMMVVTSTVLNLSETITRL